MSINWIPTEEVDTINDPIADSVGFFKIDDEFQGTGFVFKVLEGNDPHALVLTAAHVFLDSDLVLKRKIANFIVNGEIYEAFISAKEMNWDIPTNFPRDPISGNRISIPNDWLLCEIRKFPKIYQRNLNPLKISSCFDFSDRTKVTVYGYPRKIKKEMKFYCAPNSNSINIDALNDLIHGGNKLVLSRGEILSINDQIVCISSPASNGMSGGPIIVDCDDGQKVIGLIYGGPAGFLHRKINLTIYRVYSGNYLDSMKSLLKKILKQLKYMKSLSCFNSEINRYVLITRFFVKEIQKGRDISIGVMVHSLNGFYKGVLDIEVGMGKQINYNLGILCQSFSGHLDVWL